MIQSTLTYEGAHESPRTMFIHLVPPNNSPRVFSWKSFYIVYILACNMFEATEKVWGSVVYISAWSAIIPYRDQVS